MINILIILLLSIILTLIFVLYKYKQTINQFGQNTSRCFSSEKTLIQDLRKALANQELSLVYQPIVDKQRDIISIESLLRWQHPHHGFIPPEQIIQMARQGEFINQLGEWILKSACIQAAKWQKEILPTLGIAVNITPEQLTDPEFAKKVEKLLSDTELSANTLELEITEQVLIRDFKTTRMKLYQLKQLGVTISVDDFGTGYSSLGYIDKLPIDRIKIDKTFVMNINTGQEQTVLILKSIFDLAKKLGLEVLAEGVETYNQFSLLSTHYCQRFQGYYFYKPLHPNEITNLLDKKTFQIKY